METNPKSPEKPSISPTLEPIARVSAKKYRGLGDVVHAVAAPVARVIDAVAGTHLRGCAGCGRRREKWNRRFPL